MKSCVLPVSISLTLVKYKGLVLGISSCHSLVVVKALVFVVDRIQVVYYTLRTSDYRPTRASS